MGISQIFDKFYEEDKTGKPSVGSVWWVPCPDIPEVPMILQVQRSTPEEHEITDFEFVQVGPQHFKSDSRLPIKRLNLQLTEELIVTKAKRRPCVVIGETCLAPDAIASLPAGAQQRLAKHLERKSFLVVPMYSCSTIHTPGTFGPIITARIKALWYPHFCYLADFNGDPPGNVLRLDRGFATGLGRGCEALGLRVCDDVLEVVRAQYAVTCGFEASDWLKDLKELVATCLPPELKT